MTLQRMIRRHPGAIEGGFLRASCRHPAPILRASSDHPATTQRPSSRAHLHPLLQAPLQAPFTPLLGVPVVSQFKPSGGASTGSPASIQNHSTTPSAAPRCSIKAFSKKHPQTFSGVFQGGILRELPTLRDVVSSGGHPAGFYSGFYSCFHSTLYSASNRASAPFPTPDALHQASKGHPQISEKKWTQFLSYKANTSRKPYEIK